MFGQACGTMVGGGGGCGHGGTGVEGWAQGWGVLEDMPQMLCRRSARVQEYWQDQLETLGQQPKVEIEFVDCTVKVKTMATQEDGRLPNLWSPVRNLGRFCGRQTHYFRTVFEGLSMKFYPGQMCLLVGSPGSGKSTLLELIAGRLQNNRDWQVCSE